MTDKPSFCVSQYTLSVTLSSNGQIETIPYMNNYLIKVDISRDVVDSRSCYPMWVRPVQYGRLSGIEHDPSVLSTDNDIYSL